MSEMFPAELNRVARGWPLRSQCLTKLRSAHSNLIAALASLHDAPTRENMTWVNGAWAKAERVLMTCGEYKPGPSGTPSEGTKEKAA